MIGCLVAASMTLPETTSGPGTRKTYSSSRAISGCCRQLHAVGRADVRPEFVQGRFVPDPDAILVGVLIDVVELEVLEAAAPPLEEDASLGDRVALLIEHADAHGAAGLHLEVDRSHLRLDVELLHVRRPALGGDHDPDGLRLAADQPVDAVGPRPRFADVVEELGAHQRPGDRLSRFVGDLAGHRQAAIQDDLGRRLPAAARCRIRARVSGRRSGLKLG